ncbi:MAG: hypothetical protein KC668_23685 [Myxococcales bacterium]|nr:hypothetical protein [Myxococcales bacterium]
MENRRFEEIPAELREGWEPTELGAAFVELLGPHVPQDVQRLAQAGDGGFLLADPRELLSAENSFAHAVQCAMDAGVITPALQVLTNTFFLAEIPGEGDCLMFFCYRGSETAEVVVWNHEVHDFYGPVAFDLPTMSRVVRVAEMRGDVEAARASLAPCLGRWVRETFPMTLFEHQLGRIGALRPDDPWPALAMPKSAYKGIVGRAWWIAMALTSAGLDEEGIAAQLDATPDSALAKADFQDLPYSALYWLFRTYYLGEDAWYAQALARCATSQSRLVRDAAAYVQEHGASGELSSYRARAMATVARLRDPFPATVPVGALAFERDDSLASLEPDAPQRPTFPCEPGQPLNAAWQPTPRFAVPHPDGRRWLVDGRHDHPRKGRHPSIPNVVDALYEVDPATGLGTLFCDVPGEGYYVSWAEYLDEDRLLLINNGRLRLYERVPSGTGAAYLMDQVPLGQEQALVMRAQQLVMGYGGMLYMGERGWEKRVTSLSGARLVEGRLKRTGDVPLALAYVADHNGVLVGRDADKQVGYRLAGLAALPPPDRVVFAPASFVMPEKVWRAGPNAVLDSLGPSDVSVMSPAGLCLVNRLVSDPPGARRAYVGDEQGVRPTSPELDMASYALISPTLGCVGTPTAAYAVDLASGDAQLLFEYPPGSSLEVLRDGFAALSGTVLTLRDTAGAELSSVDVGEGAQLLTPTHDGALLALSTGSAPLVLITLRAGVPWLVGAVRPDGDLAGATFHPIAQPQWRYQLLAKGADGVWLDLRGVSTALAGDAPGVPLEGSLPPRPWEVAPEITRA